jgi:hypothetical protein
MDEAALIIFAIAIVIIALLPGKHLDEVVNTVERRSASAGPRRTCRCTEWSGGS